MTQQADAVRTVVAPVVEAAGLSLEAVSVSSAGSKSVVRITIDLPEDAVGSLDSDSLGDASRAISAALDTDDVVAGAYTLEISTPGTSRPLTELRHFKRARTRLVTLKMMDGSSDGGRLTDALANDDGDVLVLDGDRRILLGDVRRGKVEVELKKLDDVQDAEASELGESAGEDTDDDSDGAGSDNATEGHPGRNEEG
ncbi:ribosome maturation factor RimP [Promicromonospora iranensis]|uniref:Ribosome maturation factor RimP n=1 Tax=Promicromonospora iranensis TaxID=1105144 RepID=A0ABU2CJL5_9MICO|nr:ribosome maturation factor RimP [Promicromonospora iranensis]MDR7381508.1 ribosome maturation factor RimP [Promicromonospora iranensis]